MVCSWCVGRAVDLFVVRVFVVWKGRWICLWRGCLVVSVGCSLVVGCVLRHSLSERLVSIYLHLVVNFTFGEYSDGMICFCFGASEVVLRCFVVCVVCFCGLFTFSCAEHKIVVCVFPRRARWTSQMHVFFVVSSCSSPCMFKISVFTSAFVDQEDVSFLSVCLAKHEEQS